MMNVLRSPLRRLVAVTAVLLAALAMAGCSKKITAVDATYTAPEGQAAANAQQIVYPDRPATVYYYKSAPSTCEDCPDELVSTTAVYPSGEGIINGLIFDGTPASSYQIMRREANGGYAPLFDYALNPAQRFALSGWKVFTWQDTRPSGFDPPTYLGRGIVSGVITRTTPLTNVASGAPGSVQEIFVESDSLRTLEFTTVPEAVGYILQVYGFKSGGSAEMLFNAGPAPFATRDHRDYRVTWVPATAGTPDFERQQVLARFTLVPAATYMVRVSAVDAQGRLVGFSYGDLLSANGPDEGYYRLFRGGAIMTAAATTPGGATALSHPTLRVMAAPPRGSREISRSQVKLRLGNR